MKFSDPSFCFIAPTSLLETTRASTSHLVLAHLVDTDPVYANFYANLPETDFVMLDNSAYELKEPYSPTKLTKLAKLINADVIVLPDYPFQPPSKTKEAAEKFIPLFKDAGFGTFFVPQSETGDINGWVDSYAYAADHPEIDVIGMSILGIPNALPNISPAYARVVMTQLLLESDVFQHDKHHHYLGLNSGPALEIPSLLNMNVLDTMDSSGPIWSGILGHSYTTDADSYQTVSKIKLPVDFSLPLPKDELTLERIEHNIELTLGLFDKNRKKVVWYANE